MFLIEVLERLLSGLTVVLGVGFLIFVHELGHFVLAKLSKVRVEAFSLGFGPAIWKAIRGDTEYRLSIIPLGGYVKMAGENPGEERKHASDELWAKPALNRFLIFAAGSFMNFVIAFPICITAYLIGVNEEAPLVGSIAPGSAEWSSGLQVGDEILELDGKPVRSLKDYHLGVVLADRDRDVIVTVKRNGERVQIPVLPRGPDGYGVSPIILPQISSVEKDSPAAKGGLKAGDLILSVDGVEVDAWEPVAWRIRESADKPMRFSVRRGGAPGEPDANTETLDLTITPKGDIAWTLDVEEIVPAIIQEVKAQSPTFPFGETLEKGDRVTAIVPADDPAGKIAVRTWGDFKRAIEGMGGREIRLVADRKGKTIEVRGVPRGAKGGRALIGAAPEESRAATHVPPGSAWEKAGLAVGDEILSVGGTEVDGWFSAVRLAEQSKGEPLAVQVKREGRAVSLAIPPKQIQIGRISVYPRPKTTLHRYGFADAVVVGSEQVLSMVNTTVETLKQLVMLRLSAKGLAGPVGIFTMSYKVAEQQTTKFLWFLAFISINLAVVNLLPIPVLDGGHIMFLLIEKVRGRPVSEGVLIAAQYVGLVLLLSLIVWVTFFDVIRALG